MRRVLLDESLPRRLAGVLSGLDVVTVNEAGWSGTKNGELLRLAAGRFDVFLTGDKNLRHQQNLSKIPLGVVVVGGYSTKLKDVIPRVPRLRESIERVPHPCDFAPGHMGRLAAKLRRKLFRGLSNDLELTDYTILQEGGGFE